MNLCKLTFVIFSLLFQKWALEIWKSSWQYYAQGGIIELENWHRNEPSKTYCCNFIIFQNWVFCDLTLEQTDDLIETNCITFYPLYIFSEMYIH